MDRRVPVAEIPAALVRGIDELVGPEGRDEFIAKAGRHALRSEAIRRLKELKGHSRGLTSEVTYCPSWHELEER